MSYNAVERRTAAIAAVSKGRTTSSAISTTRENMAQGATPMQQPSPADGIIGVRAGTTAARSSRASIATPSGATGKTGGTSSSSSAPRASLASTSRSTTGTVASSSAAAPRASIASTMSSNRASARSNTTSAATTTTNAASSTARATAASRSVTSKRLGKAAAGTVSLIEDHTRTHAPLALTKRSLHFYSRGTSRSIDAAMPTTMRDSQAA